MFTRDMGVTSATRRPPADPNVDPNEVFRPDADSNAAVWVTNKGLDSIALDNEREIKVGQRVQLTKGALAYLRRGRGPDHVRLLTDDEIATEKKEQAERQAADLRQRQEAEAQRTRLEEHRAQQRRLDQAQGRLGMFRDGVTAALILDRSGIKEPRPFELPSFPSIAEANKAIDEATKELAAADAAIRKANGGAQELGARLAKESKTSTDLRTVAANAQTSAREALAKQSASASSDAAEHLKQAREATELANLHEELARELKAKFEAAHQPILGLKSSREAKAFALVEAGRQAAGAKAMAALKGILAAKEFDAFITETRHYREREAALVDAGQMSFDAGLAADPVRILLLQLFEVVRSGAEGK